MSERESRRRKNRRKDDSTDERTGRARSRLDVKPLGRRGGGKMPNFVVHHNFRYAPEPKDRVPVLKPSTGGTETWTEPTRYKPQNVRVEKQPDAEELLKELEKHPERYDEFVDRLLERMDKDFETLQREMLDSSGEKIEPSVESAQDIDENPHSTAGYFFHDSQAGSVPRKDIEPKTTETDDIPEIPPETEKIETITDNVEPAESNENDIDYETYLELEADSLGDYLNDSEDPSLENSVDISELNLDQMEDAEPIQEVEPPESELDPPEVFQELENELVEQEFHEDVEAEASEG